MANAITSLNYETRLRQDIAQGDSVKGKAYLYHVVNNSRGDLVDLLNKQGKGLDWNDRVEVPSSSGASYTTPLAIAASHQDLGMLRSLLARGADFNQSHTVHYLSQSYDDQAIRFLSTYARQHGISIDWNQRTDINGNGALTPTELAASSIPSSAGGETAARVQALAGADSAIKALVGVGAAIRGTNVLHELAVKAAIPSCQWVLDYATHRGMDIINAPDTRIGLSPASMAQLLGEDRMVEVLSWWGGKVVVHPEAYSVAKLKALAEEGDTKALDYVTDYADKHNITIGVSLGESGKGGVGQGVLVREVLVIEDLLTQGRLLGKFHGKIVLSPNAYTADKLCELAELGKNKELKYVADYADEHDIVINWDAHGERGISPLMAALYAGQTKTVQVLIDEGAQPNTGYELWSSKHSADISDDHGAIVALHDDADSSVDYM